MHNKKFSAIGTAFITICSLPGPLAQAIEPVFYRPQEQGSELLYNPAASFLNYALDSTQIRASFGTDDFSDHLDIVLDDLTHIDRAIEREGGYGEFVHTEIIPLDSDDLHESKAALPNYALHLFGGGLLFRKDAEYFARRGVVYPRAAAAVLAMVAEVLQEATEKPRTDDTDEIADVLLFRPLGIWLFSDDRRALAIRRLLDPVDWPYLLMYDLESDQGLNAGVSYVLRPPRQDPRDARFFAYVGLTNLFGLAHPLDAGASLSWGLGVATESIKPNHVRASAGVFYDRNNSLLWSVIVNGTEQLRLRANIYPGALWSARNKVGAFVGVTDDGKPALGIQFGLPVGVGVRRE